jgi:hypothetical protein
LFIIADYQRSNDEAAGEDLLGRDASRASGPSQSLYSREKKNNLIEI